MKRKVTLILIIVFLVAIPFQSQAGIPVIEKLNITGFVKNKIGTFKIKDKLTVFKKALFKKNIDVRGGIKNKDSGEAVRIIDSFEVDNQAQFKDDIKLINLDFSQTDITALETAALNGGNVYYNENDQKLYLYDGTSWIDLTQQDTDTDTNTEYTAGDNIAISDSYVITGTDSNTTYTGATGVSLSGTEFTLDQAVSPTWTGDHIFNEAVGVGTSSASALLHLSTTEDTNLLLVEDNGSGDASPFVVTSDGSVGVGIVPTSTFQVHNGSVIGVIAKISGAGSALNFGDYASYSSVFASSGEGLGLGADASFADIYIDTDNEVGISDTSPNATLDVGGYMALDTNASEPVACSATYAGAIALTSNYRLCVCNGTGWIFDYDGNACSW